MTVKAFHAADSAFTQVFNNSVTDIPAGLGLVLDTAGGGAGSDTWVRLPTTAEAGLLPEGLTTSIIRAKSWGDMTNRFGVLVPCISGAAVTKGVYVKISSVAGQEGRIIAAADGDAYVGKAWDAATAAGQVFYVRFMPGSHALGFN